MALLLAGCQTGAAIGCKEGLATELPFHDRYGHLFATTMLNDRPTNMIFDTGAEATTVTAAAASRLRLSLKPGGFATGIGGTRNGYRFVAATFQIGRLRGRNLQLYASDMALSAGGSPVDGLLGDDFLAAYDVDLDLPEHKAILFRVIEGCFTPSAALSGELYTIPIVSSSNINDHRPFVHVDVAGKTLTALVDTGALHTLIFRNAANQIGLPFDALHSDTHFHTGGIGPNQVDAVRHVMTPMTVGDLTIRNLPVAVVDQRSFDDADMLLGLDFLKRVHVWFSFSSHYLIMQFPPLASPPPAP